MLRSSWKNQQSHNDLIHVYYVKTAMPSSVPTCSAMESRERPERVFLLLRRTSRRKFLKSSLERERERERENPNTIIDTVVPQSHRNKSESGDMRDT